MHTIELRHVGGSVKSVTVLGREAGPIPMLFIDWGNMAGSYTLDLTTNQLVTIKGDRVTKKHPWGAKDVVAAKRLWWRIVVQECPPAKARALLTHPAMRGLEDTGT
jgi:hypothetical protein